MYNIINLIMIIDIKSIINKKMYCPTKNNHFHSPSVYIYRLYHHMAHAISWVIELPD